MQGSGPPSARFNQSGVVGLIPIPCRMTILQRGQVGIRDVEPVVLHHLQTCRNQHDQA